MLLTSLCFVFSDKLSVDQSTETDTLEANLESRASVAGGALAAVQQANEQERNQFNMYCVSQREQLQAKTAWEFRKVSMIWRDKSK